MKRNALLIGLMGLIILAAHALLLQTGVTPKLYPLASTFQAMETGTPVPLGTMLSVSGVELGGPLYYWLHYPLAWLQLPFYGVHLMYMGLELLTLLLWFSWGRHHFSERLVLWVGLALALCPYTKTEMGESSLFLVILPWLALLAMLSALRRRRAVTYLAPALLWGVALQFHLSALFIGPAVLLAIWLTREHRWRNLLMVAGGFTVAGLLPTFLPLLAQQERLAQLGELVKLVVQERSPSVILASLVTVLVINGPALAGLVLLLRRERRPRTWLLALWMGVPLALVLLMDPDDFKPWHYVILSPAFAILTGVALARLEERARGSRKWPSRLFTLEACVKLTLAALLLALGLLHFSRGLEQDSTDPCQITRQIQLPEPFAATLQVAKSLAVGVEPRRVRFSGLAHDHLAGGLWFETRGARLDFWTPTRPEGSAEPEVFVGFPSPALASVPASGRLLALDGLRVVTPTAVLRPAFTREQGVARSSTFNLPAPLPRHAVVHLEGDLGFAAPDLRLVSDGITVRPTSDQVCSQWGRFEGQYTFDLAPFAHRRGPVRLEVRHRAGVINYLAEVVLFSGR